MSLKLPYQVSHHRCWVSSCSVWCRVVHCTLVHSPVTGSSHAGSWGTRAQPPGNESGHSRRGPEENTEKRMRRLSHCNHLFTALSPLQHKYGIWKGALDQKEELGVLKDVRGSESQDYFFPSHAWLQLSRRYLFQKREASELHPMRTWTLNRVTNRMSKMISLFSNLLSH